VKGRTMPTHSGSNMTAGQKAEPGETMKVKSQALLKRRRQHGVINLGIRTT
jgi:hypothetical protein